MSGIEGRRALAEQYQARELGAQRSRMTMGQAAEIEKAGDRAFPPCACLGGSSCCLIRSLVAEDLTRGAHIAAKLMASVTTTNREGS